ncbi:hypothetical protein vseg_013310 [Gypsophila vaccaria]
MQRFGSKFFINGFQNLQFLHGFQRFYLHSTAISKSNSIDCCSNYLVSSLGFPHQQALSISAKLSNQCRRLNDLNISLNADLVVRFFEKHGFDDTRIRKMVSLNPRLLYSKVDKTLKPKFDFFMNEGFSRDDVIRVISANSNILMMSLDSSIAPALQIFRTVMTCDADVVNVLKNLKVWSFGAIAHHLLANVELLSGYGVPMELIRKHLLQKPLTFLRKPDIFKKIVCRVESRFGISKESPLFMYGIHLVSSFSEENIEAKFQMFKSFGWKQSDVETFIMKNASCFTISEAHIKKKMEFLMNEMGFDPAYLIAHTSLLTCSLDKRVVPRHKVLLVLKEKGLMKKIPVLVRVVQMSEPTFVNRFVLPFEEVHEVYAKHIGCSMKMLTKKTIEY